MRRLAALLLLILPTTSAAAPLPPVRSLPARSAAARPALPERLTIGSGVERVCGSHVEAVADAVRDHLARVSDAPLPTPYSTDVGDIAVLEDDGRFFFIDKNNRTHVDLAAVAEAFYRTHGDEYTALAIYLASGLPDWLGSPGALASATVIRNQIQGIGLDAFDYGASFASPANLEILLNMNALDRYPADPAQSFPNDNFSTLDVLAHEFGHRWGAYVFVDSAGNPSPALLGRDDQHWNFFFDSDSSYMEGNDWAIAGPDSFRTDGAVNGYGTLDLYLMGMMAKSEIDSFFVVNDPTSFDPPGTYIPASASLVGLGCDGRATWWHIPDIEAENGPRVPDAASAPHAFRMAMILVTARDSAANPADLQKLETIRSAFGPTFATATRGRGSVDLHLTKHAGTVRIEHAPLPDTEDGLSPRPVGTRVTIDPGGIPLAVDPSSVSVFWRLQGTGAYSTAALAPAGSDSFAGSIPAFPSGSTVEYYLHAASDSVGIDAFDPPGGASAPHVYQVGPDVTPPAVVHHAVPEQAPDRLPQTLLARVTDNLGLDAVWLEYTLDGGAVQTVGAVPAGRDSFAASMGSGVGAGHTLAYRFVARDRATLPNLGTSNAAFDTLRVDPTRAWDVENGTDGFIHAPQWYSYRDAWHPTQEASSPAGGTGWKCGADDSGPYPPHLDANLYTPPFSLTGPSFLTFDHRYELEQADASHAWDGARLEISVNGTDWQILAPVVPYDHVFILNSNPFQYGAPCWSGSSSGWRSETVDLSPYAPATVRIRFRMLADDLIGYSGWFVDHIRVAPGNLTGVAPAPTVAAGIPWPNPARDALHVSLSLTRPTRVEWALYDVAGRRAQDLYRGLATGGALTLHAPIPQVPAGLYFARLTLDGRPSSSARVVVVR